jgi:hypothetical protein
MKSIRFIWLFAAFGPIWTYAQVNTGAAQEEKNKQSVESNSVQNQLNENSTNVSKSNPSAVPSIAEPSRTAQSSTYYRTQSSALHAAVMANPYDARAWQNYYEAELYSYYTKTSNDISEEQQDVLNGIVTDMAKYIPETFEFHYISYLNGHHDTKLFGHLARAFELRPNATELYDEFVAYYEMIGDASKKAEWCKKLNETKEISKETMEFTYNLIIGLEKNAILFTHGELDTYPSFIWQSVKKTRTDLIILDLDLLEKDEYRVAKLNALGVSSNIHPLKNKAAFLDDVASKLSASRPVYLATTVAPEILGALKSKLINTGLAFRYSNNEFDNLSFLMENWEGKFKKDELSKKITPGTLTAKMNMNYVPGLILLAEHLRSIGANEKAKIAEDLAVKFAQEGGKEQQVKTMLNRK